MCVDANIVLVVRNTIKAHPLQLALPFHTLLSVCCIVFYYFVFIALLTVAVIFVVVVVVVVVVVLALFFENCHLPHLQSGNGQSHTRAPRVRTRMPRVQQKATQCRRPCSAHSRCRTIWQLLPVAPTVGGWEIT